MKVVVGKRSQGSEASSEGLVEAWEVRIPE